VNGGERLPGSPAPLQVWRTPTGFHFAADAWGDPQAGHMIAGDANDRFGEVALDSLRRAMS